MNQSQTPRLRQIFDELESKYSENEEQQEPIEYNPEELIAEISKLNELNNRLHEAYQGINESIPKLIKNAKCASHHLMTELQKRDPFSHGLVKENSKEIRALSEKLETEYEKVREPLLKLASLTEDLGTKVDRYYNIY